MNVNVNRLLLLAAFLSFVVAFLCTVGVIDAWKWEAATTFGLAAWVAAELL